MGDLIGMFRGPVEKYTGRNWPSTPPDERLMNASGRVDLIRQGNILRARARTNGAGRQEKRDAQILAQWYNAQEHQMTWFVNRTRLGLERTADERFDLLADAAQDGDTSSSIGISVEGLREWTQEEQDRPDSELLLPVALNFDKAPRDETALHTALLRTSRTTTGASLMLEHGESAQSAPANHRLETPLSGNRPQAGPRARPAGPQVRRLHDHKGPAADEPERLGAQRTHPPGRVPGRPRPGDNDSGQIPRPRRSQPARH